MSHPDLEVLLRAVDQPSDEETRRHLATCTSCRNELATMARTRSAGERLARDPAEGALVSPPRKVWEDILRGLGDQAPAPADPRGGESLSTVTPITSRSGRPGGRRRWLVVAASVAAGAVLGASVAALANRDGTDTTEQAGRTSSLVPLDRHVTHGTLAMSGPSTHQSLSVTLNEADPGDGFLEVWLLDARTGGMVSLGVVDGDRGTYAVPPGLDLSAYDQVDVSREPYDGDPAHSKVSLARGRVP